MDDIEHSLVPLMPQHAEWACETCGAVVALDREADDPHRLLEVHRRWHSQQQGMRESRIARARGLAQAIAACRDDARLDAIREGAAEIDQLLGGQ